VPYCGAYTAVRHLLRPQEGPLSTALAIRRSRHTFGSAVLVAVAAVLAVAVGALVAKTPLIAAGGAGVALLVAVVWARPQVAAYLIIGFTPLVAGIDRGTLFPVLRPNEALALVLVGTLSARALVRLRVGVRPQLRVHPLEISLVLLAVTSSVVPIALVLVRGRHLEADDISYALVLWKYLAVYGLVRFTIHTDDQVGRCLLISVASAGVLGIIGALQALDLFGVRQLLMTYYIPSGYTDALAIPRGGSTLSLPAAAADLLIFNLALVIAMWWKDRRHPIPLGLLAGICVFGAVAAAEFSSAIGLVIGMVCVAAALRRLDLVRFAPPALAVAIAALWPVVSYRLQEFNSLAGMPASWVGRLHNLETYFWPELMKGTNLLFGVRPAARVVVPSQGTGFVWIESGYTWLFWGGGIPLFAAFCYFVFVSTRTMWSLTRPLESWSAVAAVGAFTGVVVVTFLMLFDPHLTYRGAADCLYALLALALVGRRNEVFGESPPSRESTSDDELVGISGAGK
jgi:hypothetical protein